MAITIPVDKTRCQAEKPNGNSFMTLGGKPGLVRCSNKPTVIARETKPSPIDGLRGEMALCDECKNVLIKQLGSDYCSFEQIGE